MTAWDSKSKLIRYARACDSGEGWNKKKLLARLKCAGENDRGVPAFAPPRFVTCTG